MPTVTQKLRIGPPFIKEPIEAYNSYRRTHIGSTSLNVFRESPRLYRRMQLAPERFPEREYEAFGRAAHVYLLEGQKAFHAAFSVSEGPINPRTGEPYGKKTNAYQNWLAEQFGEILPPADFKILQEIEANLTAHPYAAPLLAKGAPELTLRCEYRGLPCQVRLDWLNPNKGIADLKTTWNLRQAKRDAYRHGYLHQAAFYRRILQQETGETLPCHLIIAEKEEPYAVALYQINEDDLDGLAQEIDNTLDKLADCIANDDWPTGFETVQEMSLFQSSLPEKGRPTLRFAFGCSDRVYRLQSARECW